MMLLTVSAGIANAMPMKPAAPVAPQRGVHPDHVAGEIEGRPARASLVGGRVDLNEIVVPAVPDVAAFRRDDPGRHRAVGAVGRANDRSTA
jgi:hypothetical protein